MYTRDFTDSDTEIKIPPSYCGSTFQCEESLHKECAEEAFSENHGAGSLGGISKLIPSSLLNLKSFSVFKNGFGTEEILILALAAFLLFSKDGDKECAIILLLVLFLN